MGEKKLTKRDRINMFLRTNLQQASFNYERMHGLGMAFDMVPAIKRLYDTKEEQVAALKRHLTFFNVTPAAVGPVLGVTAALEESKANGADIDEGTIGSIKIGLMGPFCGVGDPDFLGNAASDHSSNRSFSGIKWKPSWSGFIFAAFNLVRLAALYFGLEFGYKKGLDFVQHLAGNMLQKVTEGASILGLFVMGALVSAWTTIKCSAGYFESNCKWRNNNYYCTGYSGPAASGTACAGINIDRIKNAEKKYESDRDYFYPVYCRNCRIRSWNFIIMLGGRK